MNIYQLEEGREEEICAGAKAPADASAIVKGMGAISVNLGRAPTSGRIARLFSRVKWVLSATKSFHRIEKGAVVFLQYPRIFLWSRLGMRFVERLVKSRKLKLITLIHDINELRGVANKEDWDDLWRIVSISSIIIVHNKNMRDWYIGNGVPKDKIVELGVFDYLSEGIEPLEDVEFVPCITLASNLISTWGRGGFLTQLKEIKDVTFELYGPNYDEKLLGGENVHYNGCFPAEAAPRNLVKGFGLVWGGDSIDTCSGVWGEYFRYISPHRLSSYLASGLPVAVWAGSGQAEFVMQHKVGIVIKSLREAASVIDAVTKEEYMEYRKNALELSKKLRRGYFLTQAMQEAIRRVSGIVGIC